MKKRKIIIGSRESQLAVVQSRLVIRYLNETHPEVETELLTMKTTGDKILDRRLDQIGGKGLFVKELDKALMEHRSDFSVHSLKDLPMEVPAALPIVAYSRREDPRDVLVLPKGCTEIDFSKPIGTSSLRRILQLKKLFPDASFESVRGNLQTRIRKLDEGQYGAIILAAAGMKRMGLADRISRFFSVDEVIPSAGQAILAVQGREDEDASVFDGFRDEDATFAATAERAFVRYLNGGCSSPIAAHATIFENAAALQTVYADTPSLQLLESDIQAHNTSDDAAPDGGTKLIYLRGLYYNEENGAVRTGTGVAPASEAERLGIRLAEKLRKETNER
ncbi:MAG: hydroxymethylbilane synthase [Eubacterium sp.]|nr:hydroxymethylbilane synthase [Eubacterium sp.]